MALRKLFDVLEYIGIDLCPIDLAADVEPLLGVLRGQITANFFLFFFARGDFVYLYDEDIRGDKCDDAEGKCSFGEFDDCALCQGDILATVELGANFIFTSVTVRLAETDTVSGCATSSPEQRCINGLGSSLKDVGVSCDVHAECLNDACGRTGFDGDSLACCASGHATRVGGFDYCTEQPDGTKCGGTIVSVDSMCASGLCRNDICTRKKPVGESCSLNLDCENNACGRNAYIGEGNRLTCCESGRNTRSGGFDYCTERPRGTRCGVTGVNSDAMCASGKCSCNGFLCTQFSCF